MNVKPGQRLDLKELASEAHFACGCGSAWARQRREALPFTSSWGDDPNSQDCEPKTHVDQTRWTVHSAFPASAVGAVGAASSDAEAIEQVLAARNREAEWRRTLIAALQKAEALPGLQRKNQQPSESNASPRWMKAVACTSCKRTAAEASDQQRLGSLASIGTKGMDKDMELSASTGVSVATDPEFQHPKARKQADMSSGKVPPLPQTSRATKEEPESAMGQVTFGCPARPSEERQSCSNNIDRLTGDLPPLPSSDPALRIPAWMIDMEGTDGESGKIVEGATRSPWKISARAAGFRAAAFTINIRSSPEADSR